MMFTGSKSALACASVFLALAAQASAHAIPSPALGVKGTPKRSDVQRPSNAKPCGNIDPASTIDSSTAVPAAADGTVNIDVINFNAGGDGSTSVSVQVDATGVGNKFVAGTVKTNGNPKPTKVETDKVVFSLPAGTKCTGGKAKNLCLVSVKTTSNFGACVVVSQAAAAAPPPPPAQTTAAKVTTTAAQVKTTAAQVTTTAAQVTASASASVSASASAASASVSATSNKDTTNKAGAAKNTSSAGKKGKKHHHHKGKGKGKGMKKGKQAGNQAQANQAGNQAQANQAPGNQAQGTQEKVTFAASNGKKMMREEEASALFIRDIIDELEAHRREYDMERQRRAFFL